MDTTNTNFLVNTTAPLNLNFTTATLISNYIGATSSTREELT